MRLIDKFVFIIYSVVFLIISIIAFILPFDVRGDLSIDNIVNVIYNIRGNYLISLIGAIIIVVLVSYMLSFLSNTTNTKKKKGSYLILNNEFGEVTIYDETVIGLVNTVIKEFEGITKIVTKVTFKDGKINIILKGEAQNEISIPQISQELQEKIKNNIEESTGAIVNNVDVEIVKVTV